MAAKKMTIKTRIKPFVMPVVVVILVIGVAVGLYLITPKATPALPSTDVRLTDTPDYNTCSITTTKDIKNTFYSEAVTGISPGLRAGVKAPNDTIADSCRFGLTTAKSLNNSLSVQVYPYTAIVNGDDKETVDPSWSEVAASNPKAYFGKDIEGEAIIYKLRVIPGGKNVMFELRQPMNSVAIDEPSALDFLVGIATKADLSVIEPTTDQ